MKNLHTDLDKYTLQWEKALEDGIFADAPTLPQPSRDTDYFGNIGGEENVPLNECDAKYWDRVYRLSKDTGPGFVPDPLLKEEKERKKATKRSTDKIANSSNPVYPFSVGKDQDFKPTKNWSDGPELRELAELKKRLERLESEMNAKDGLGKNSKSVEGQIEDLKKKLDDLSDSLTNNRFGSDDDDEEN